jgi:tetratricopeptide (TPR) repeat protein
LTLLPVIGFVQVGSQVAADRYTYFPGLGIALLFGLGVGMIYKMIMTLNKARIAMLALLLVSLIWFFGMNVFFLQKQIAVWKDSISLWDREIKLYPNITAIPYKNRGAAFYNAGMFKDSIKDYKTAIKLRPNDHTTHANIALSFLKIGDRQNAISSFKTAARLGNVSVQKLLTSKGVKW